MKALPHGWWAADVPLLNYTTTVAATKTVGEIHNILVKAGARQIMTEFDEQGRATAVMFSFQTPLGIRQFSLPTHADKVLQVLHRQKVGNRYATKEQAERVAWRIVKDWLEAQLAIIATEMVSLDQVMLPYMRSGDGRTVYQLYVDQNLDRMLEAAPNAT